MAGLAHYPNQLASMMMDMDGHGTGEEAPPFWNRLQNKPQTLTSYIVESGWTWGMPQFTSIMGTNHNHAYPTLTNMIHRFFQGNLKTMKQPLHPSGHNVPHPFRATEEITTTWQACPGVQNGNSWRSDPLISLYILYIYIILYTIEYIGPQTNSYREKWETWKYHRKILVNTVQCIWGFLYRILQYHIYIIYIYIWYKKIITPIVIL